MALATLQDLRDYMNIDLSNVQEDAAQMVLDGLHIELETYLHRPIEQQQFTERYLVPESWTIPTDTSVLIMPGSPTTLAGSTYVQLVEQSPIVSVTSLTRQGPSESSATTLTEKDDFVVAEYGYGIYILAGVNPLDEINITYTAGLDGANISYFKLLILRAASREIQNMHDDVVGLKDLNTRNVGPLDTGFLDSELSTVKRWKRVRI